MEWSITVRPFRLAAAAAAVAATMFVLGSAALLLTSAYGRVVPVWPANAAALAIILRSPAQWRPTLLAAAAAACLAANLATGDALNTAAAYAAFNAGEMGILLLLFGRGFDRAASVEPLAVFIRFAVAAAVASVGSAALAAAFAAATGGSAPVAVFATWFMADLLGLMTITPLLLSLTGPARNRSQHAASAGEAVLIVGATVVTATALFIQPAVPPILVAPLLLLAGFRLPARATALVVLLVAAIGIVATLNGFGPIADGLSGAARMVGLQLFVASTAALTLPVTAIVAERERLLVALAGSELGFRRMVEASTAGVLQFDPAGSLNFVNHRWTELTGLALDDSIGDGWLRVFDGAARARARALPDGARCGDGTVELLPYRRPDGSAGWAELSCDPERDEAGVLVGHVCRIVDITVRRQAELIATESAAMLRKTNRLLLMAEELADVGHWRVGLWRDDFDYSTQASVIGGVHGSTHLDLRQALALLDPAGRTALFRCIVRTGRGASECESSARLRRPDGALRHVILRIQAEFRDGALTGLFGVISDVTAKVTAERALIAARDSAQSAARAKSEFAATMSHEIRTPMTGVMGMIDLLRDGPDSAERGQFIEAMKQSADLLMSVLDNVLDFSLAESGKLALKLRDFDVAAVAQSTVSMFINTASRKGLTLSLSFDAGSGSIAHGDPVRLQQVLSNLIANAVKFTAAGAIEVAVRARPLRSGIKHWCVNVCDSGPGIPAAECQTLFQPFVQAHSVAGMGGTGLGLAISRSLIDAMGGTIGVRSAPGCGSTFWFELDLPVGSAARLSDPGRPPSVPQPRALDVLLAEDNPVNQMLVEAILHRMGHAPTCVANGRLAVEAAAERRFDCILMDMQMPELDGIAATRAIRAGSPLNAMTPIVALTADAAPERRRFYDNAGLTAFMTKPIDSTELGRLLDRLSGARPVGRSRSKAAKLADVALDVQRIAELRNVLGEQRVGELLRMLARELGAKLPAIAYSARCGDLDTLRRLAHGLKGAALSIGADGVGVAAAAVESSEGAELRRAVVQLKQAAEAANRAIDQQTAGHAAKLASA